MLCFIKKINVLLKIDVLLSLTRLHKEWDRVISKTKRLQKGKRGVKKEKIIYMLSETSHPKTGQISLVRQVSLVRQISLAEQISLAFF
jgi:hypothetical protein